MNRSNLRALAVSGFITVLMVAIMGQLLASVDRAEATVGDGAQQINTVHSFDGLSPHVIPAAAFVSDGYDPESYFFPFSGGYIEGDATNYGCVVAPVYLPNGVLITDMFVSVYDDDPGRGITVNLRRVNNFSGVTDTMASVSTTVTGTFSGIEVLNDNSIDEPQTVYPDYSYYVTTCVLSSLIRLYSVRLYFVPVADLSVEKTGPVDPTVGIVAPFEVNVTNYGPSDATNVVVTDVLPAGLAFAWASPACSEVSGTVTCNLGSLAVGETESVTISLKPTMVGDINNSADVVSDDNDPNTANNTDAVTVTVQPAYIYLPIILE
ncbi:MAG: DUF11 domain-containing protein [Anaerolineae bacterium]|nr:DUF11 domain-containing protein [Anaerolineae bacterium]MCO5187267.1 DUF11 domain-containing protein [Anaerolineae bacterium]MCO5191753.1 DUF11 domain-containing protein [Anaerolineae bacterium]MCO5198994.1 DUF11 domain-containing protein [Anaerolineae bacterium]MCO5206271.1 DUF11 domain-containing protein [Anaerolineae bacterium]